MAKGARTTPEERRATVDKIDAFRKEGMGLQEACKKSGIADKSYYNWKSMLSKAEKKPRKVHKFVDIPQAPKQTQVAVVLCSPEQLKSVLEGLA